MSATSLVGRDLLSVADFSAAEVGRVFATATALKAEFRATRRHAAPPLTGRTLAMLFQKPSLRTRVTFEAGMAQLGGHAIYLTHDVVLGARESVRDVARNLERFVDAIVVRTGSHEVAIELAAQAGIPVINGLTLREHPCQALADVFTIRERFGRLEGCRSPSSATATTSTTRWRCSARRSGWRSASRIRSATRPNERIVARAARAGGGIRRAVDLRPRPGRGGPRRRRRLHRCLDLDGPGGRDRGAPRRVRRLPGRRRPDGRGRARRASRCTACPPIAARRSPHR